MSMAAVYGLTITGLLFTLAWLLQRTLLRRSKDSEDIEGTNSITDKRKKKDTVIVESIGVKCIEWRL